jgi:hypothetical protein
MFIFSKPYAVKKRPASVLILKPEGNSGRGGNGYGKPHVALFAFGRRIEEKQFVYAAGNAIYAPLYVACRIGL